MADPIEKRINARVNIVLALEHALECLRDAEKEATREHTRMKALLGPKFRWPNHRGSHPGYVQKEVERLAKETYLLLRKVERVQ